MSLKASLRIQIYGLFNSLIFSSEAAAKATGEMGA